jgi:hypothetical protein
MNIMSMSGDHFSAIPQIQSLSMSTLSSMHAEYRVAPYHDAHDHASASYRDTPRSPAEQVHPFDSFHISPVHHFPARDDLYTQHDLGIVTQDVGELHEEGLPQMQDAGMAVEDENVPLIGDFSQIGEVQEIVERRGRRRGHRGGQGVGRGRGRRARIGRGAGICRGGGQDEGVVQSDPLVPEEPVESLTQHHDAGGAPMEIEQGGPSTQRPVRIYTRQHLHRQRKRPPCGT